MLVRTALALVTAVLLVLSFPKWGLAVLAPFALGPLLAALASEPRGRRRFVLGYAAGLVFWAGTCYWIQFVLNFHAGIPGWVSWIGFAVFCLYKALHLGAFAWLAGPLMNTRWAVLAVPALWVAIERTHATLGFTWLALGNAGIDMGLPARLAPFTGVWGLSFVFAVMGTALALAATRRRRIELAPALIVLIVFALPALPPARRGDVAAVLVQPNISQTEDWTPEWIERQHQRLLSLSGQGRPALIVWPEVPAPLYYAADPKLREAVDSLAAATGAHVILNTVPRREDGMPLNSALMVAPGRGAVGRYDKMNLVPFGEFVPWPFKAFLDKISTETGDFAPGRQQVLLPAGEHRIGAFVCYESVFAGFVRNFPARGAELLVNISNDGWYGATAARDQHLSIVRMRAAENRRWVLRATNDGITATIDPAGRAHRRLPSFVAGAAEARFQWIGSVTFYSRFGDWFVWFCAAGALAPLVRTRARRPATLRPPAR